MSEQGIKTEEESEQQRFREYIAKKMREEQERADQFQMQQNAQRAQQPQHQQQPQQLDPLLYCPHGVSLAKFCKRCDFVTEDQISDRIPIN